MCAVQDFLQIPSYEWRKISFSIVAILCSNALPVQPPPGPAFFLFLPIPQFFSATSLSGGEISFLSPGGVAAAPGFTHNWLTRLQRGREPIPLVSFPYPALKTAHRRSQGRVWFHSRFLVCFCSGSDAKSRSSL